ncbi:MAG: tRNA-dihydrouridine synthase family protein [Candidatus Woesearchaeota archaeon]|jgi:tRNA-dihydrouridine synthase B|nr:tRNA-dihydrouridine synthase family protein [Candidatus Woesearchaeota archaeon]
MKTLYFPPINKLGNSAFRKLCLYFGADFVFTEIIRVDKLIEDDEVQLRKASIDKNQINQTLIQIIAEDIENIEKGVEKVIEINPGVKEINYNMGCPQSTLCSKELGGGIIKNPSKVFEVSKRLSIICSKHSIIPSVKLRIGITREQINILEIVEQIQLACIKKIYIHGRTLRNGYNRPATYNEIKEVKEKYPELEIIANGDVFNLDSYNEIIKTNCDGVLIGRAALENPKIFKLIKNHIIEDNKSGTDLNERKEAILKYLEFAKEYNTSISHIKANLSYLTRNTIGGAEFRKSINDLSSIEEILEVI